MMKNILLIILFFSFSGIYAQNNRCNFVMEIQGDFLKDSTYDLASISFAGIKPKHHKRLIGMIDYNKPRQVTLTVQFFQEFLGAICQYDKYEISKVMIAGSEGEIQLLLVYKKIGPTGKSKN